MRPRALPAVSGTAENDADLRMTVFQALILGVIQGLTEFLPVSSSGHLVIFQSLFGLKEQQLTFDIFLHFATLLSVLVYFRNDIIALFGKERRMLPYIVMASIPTFVIAMLFKSAIEGFFESVPFVGGALVITGMWLIWANSFAVRQGANPIGMGNSILIGIAQGIAILPGISRSGSTIATGLLSGLKKEDAFRFSFLLSIPAILGATLLKFSNISYKLAGVNAGAYLIGGAAAAVTGFMAIGVLSRAVMKNKLYFFGIYCFIAGTLCIILVNR